jgi:hypothetical protein
MDSQHLDGSLEAGLDIADKSEPEALAEFFRRSKIG